MLNLRRESQERVHFGKIDKVTLSLNIEQTDSDKLPIKTSNVIPH